jgi:hypothetical protein
MQRKIILAFRKWKGGELILAETISLDSSACASLSHHVHKVVFRLDHKSETKASLAIEKVTKADVTGLMLEGNIIPIISYMKMILDSYEFDPGSLETLLVSIEKMKEAK